MIRAAKKVLLPLAWCAISACQPAPPADPNAVSWYHDVQPLTVEHCQGCHVAGGIAPFSMETYAQAKVQAAAMAADAQSGKMPPWKPAASCGMDYVGDKRLTPAQIDVLTRWSDQGMPEGDAADAPPPSNTGTGALEWVDQTIAPALAYTPDSSLGADDYHCSLIDPALVSDRSVVGYQVLPQIRAEVHHVILYAVARADAQALDHDGKGWTCFGGPGIDDAIFIGGWAPGAGAVEFPSDTGINVPSKDVFVMQVHYNLANGVDQADQTQMQLQYATHTVTQAVVAPVADGDFSVPPMAMGYTPPYEPLVQPNTFGVPVKIWGVFPHMHTHGTHIKVTGPEGCLIDIPEWDFHWQQQYFFKQPVTVQDGQAVGLTCTWDNPTDKALTWGESTSDEMCLAFLYITL